MDNIGGLFSLNGGQSLSGREKENDIQGLFHDLLACLAGGDNPNLPTGYKQKPMTGFCDILDAFNETVRVREAGSGMVCEVNSSDIMSPSSPGSGEISEKTSDETLKTTEPESEQVYNTDSAKSFHGRNLQTPTDVEADCSQSNTSVEYHKLSHLPSFNRLAELLTPYESIPEQPTERNLRDDEKSDNVQSEAESYQDAFDYDGENPVLSMLKANLVEEVGPPLSLSPSQSSLARPDSGTGKGLHNYADQLREIEQILKENASNISQFTCRTEFPRGGMSVAALIGNGILPSFPEVLMNPATVLERVCGTDGLSAKSPRHPQSSNHISTYQSCTSIPGYVDHSQTNDSMGSALTGSVKRSPSHYMDLDETVSDVDFIAALDAAICEEEGACGQVSYKDTYSSKINTNDDSAPYYSVHEDSDEQNFEDAGGDAVAKKQKKKRKALKKAQNATSSEERLWTWTSASNSEYDDAH